MKRNPALDSLIDEGRPLPEIHRILGINVQAAHSYIRRSGQQMLWRERSVLRKAGIEPAKRQLPPAESVQALAETLARIAIQKAYAQSWAEGKAQEHLISLRFTPHRTLEREELVAIFTAYEQHRDSSTPLYSISKDTGISVTTVKSVLERRGLPFTTQAAKRMPFGAYAIKAAHSEGLSFDDMAYLSGFHEVALKRKVKEPLGMTPRLKWIALERGTAALTYRLASQIYEAADLGFTVDEITQLYDTHKALVVDALENRATYAPPITRALKRFHPGKAITRAYLNGSK